MSALFFIFFFSSRRRHTISTRDWSSDVCSSDLRLGCRLTGRTGPGHAREAPAAAVRRDPDAQSIRRRRIRAVARGAAEIGRASCRERGEIGEGEETEKKEATGVEDRREWMIGRQ